jgi:predicted nucleic acid-binding protein
MIVKLYFPETLSESVEKYVKENKIIIPFNSFHELEISNAIELKEFRNEISHEEKIGILHAIRDDKRNGILHPYPLSWNRVFTKSKELSAEYSSNFGTRTLDIIHVASAVCVGFENFLSLDERQNRLAEKAGLHLCRLG